MDLFSHAKKKLPPSPTCCECGFKWAPFGIGPPGLREDQPIGAVTKWYCTSCVALTDDEQEKVWKILSEIALDE